MAGKKGSKVTLRARAGNRGDQVQECKAALAEGLTRLGIAPRMIEAARSTMDNLYWFKSRKERIDLAWGDVIAGIDKGAEFLFILHVGADGSVLGCIANGFPGTAHDIGTHLLPASRLLRPIVTRARAMAAAEDYNAGAVN